MIWVFDASGPPPDSRHAPDHFQCGFEGTLEEHNRRMADSHGACGFVGFWHTHPSLEPDQSIVDIGGMADLVSRVGQNQKRAMMLIFGEKAGRPTVTFHVYESHSVSPDGDLIAVGVTEMQFEESLT